MRARFAATLAILLTLVLGAMACSRGPKSNVPLAEDAKTILVFGPAGRIGSRIVDEALSRGHWVTAVVHSTPVDREHPRLTIARGDVTGTAAVAALYAGHDVAISAVGGPVRSGKPKDAIALAAAKTMVEAARELDKQPPRLIFVGGAGTLEVRDGVLLLDELEVPSQGFAAMVKGHQLVLEFLRTVDDVEWTVATPPRRIRAGRKKGNYRWGADAVMRDAKGRSRISTEDFAAAMLDEIEKPRYVGRRYTVAY